MLSGGTRSVAERFQFTKQNLGFEKVVEVQAERDRVGGHLLTVVGGKVVFGAEEFEDRAPPALPVSPDWSPVKEFGGYGAPHDVAAAALAVPRNGCCVHGHQAPDHRSSGARLGDWLAGPAHAQNQGCSCFAF